MRKQLVLTNVYRLLRLEESDGKIIKKELIKTIDFRDIIDYAKREVYDDGHDITIEVW